MDGKKKILYRAIFFLSLAANVIIAIFIFTPLTNWLYAYLEVKPQIQKADAIILLSAATYTEEMFSRDTYQRMLHAFTLYNQGYADKIIICGGAQEEGMSPIAEIMKTFLVKIGVNEKNIITESHSQNTYENIKNILGIFKVQDIQHALLVTSSYHMYRSLAICEQFGVNVSPAPVPCYERDISHIHLRTGFISTILREYGAIVYFWLRGWIAFGE